MKLKIATMLVPLACLAIAGCDQAKKITAPKAPTGQVVATVEGEEVTVRELRAELEGMTFPNEAARKQAEHAALQNIINRKLLAKAARAAEVDKSPDFALQKARAEEALLAQSLQKKIVEQMPAISSAEASSYVALHPDLYAERKVYTVDQIRFAMPADPALMKGFEPLTTMEEVEAYLAQHKIAFERGASRIDTLQTDPRLTEQIVKLPPNEVFIVPTPQGILINQIRDTRVVPFTGDQAVQHAQALLKRQRTQEALSRQMGDIQKQAAGKVQIAKGYEAPKPAPAPKAAPAAAPAAAAEPAKTS